MPFLGATSQTSLCCPQTENGASSPNGGRHDSPQVCCESASIRTLSGQDVHDQNEFLENKLWLKIVFPLHPVKYPGTFQRIVFFLGN